MPRTRVILSAVVLPLAILIVAALAATVVGYGTHPGLAQFAHGIELIVWSRRLLWPATTVSIVLCLALVGLVVSGKRRAWWLIGLGPILALFVHRFHTDPNTSLAMVENPQFVGADQAAHITAAEWVVGLTFNGKAYAYPYSALFLTPVVMQTDHDQRMMLMWSAYANRAVACTLTRELRLRDLEIVSTPAGSLLLYDSRLGQFIVGVTGRTLTGAKPVGFAQPIATAKMTWAQWRAAHPQTLVMRAAVAPRKIVPPTGPLLPTVSLPRLPPDAAPDERIVLLETEPPCAFRAGAISEAPANFWAADVPVLMFRVRGTGQVRAYDRRLEGDLVPRFVPNPSPRRPGLFVDKDSNSTWDASGRAVDGPLAREGRRLRALAADDALPWGIVRTWYPQLQLRVPEGGGWGAAH